LKIDKYVKDLSEKLDDFSNGNNVGNGGRKNLTPYMKRLIAGK
jgi:hypothetical protein